VTDPGRWWIFQPRGRPRPQLTPIGLAWTLGFYGALGALTSFMVTWLVGYGSPSGPVLFVLLGSAGWTALRVAVDGRLVRGSAWLVGAGWLAFIHLVTEAPTCGTSLVFGGGLPGVSPGGAPCLPHQDFMTVVFVGGWVLLGPLAAVFLSSLELYRWQRHRRDPLNAFRLLTD